MFSLIVFVFLHVVHHRKRACKHVGGKVRLNTKGCVKGEDNATAHLEYVSCECLYFRLCLEFMCQVSANAF